MSFRYWLVPLFLGTGIGLAYLIGERMSAMAMAVVVGVAVGVVTSLPVSLLLIALLRRERQPSIPTPRPDGYPYPPAFPLPTQATLDLNQLLRQAAARPQPQATFSDHFAPLPNQFSYDSGGNGTGKQ